MAKPNANAQAASAPVSSKPNEQAQPLVKWEFGQAMPDTAGAKVLKVNEATGRVNKQNQPILSKSLVIRAPSVKETGKSGDAAKADITAIGTAIKPAVMGRVSAFSNQGNTFVRKYTETPAQSAKGNDKLTLVLERVKTVDLIEQFARQYKLTAAEIRQKLGIKSETPDIAV